MILNSRILGSSHKKIIILHGLLGSLDNWITFGKKISNEGFEVHLVDQRNHGKSFHSNEFSYEHMAKDLKNYFIHFNIEKASIIGHSMGGKTAMLFALSNVDLINKLIIVDILPISYKRDYELIFDSLLNIELNTDRCRNDFYIHLKNIEFFSQNMPFLDEVSIGHALISESLYIGLENVINLYINKLNK